MQRPSALDERPTNPALDIEGSAPLARVPSDLGDGPRPSKPGFVAGVRAFLGGLGALFTTPGVLPLSLVPIAVTFAVTAGLGVLSVKLVPWAVASIVGSASAWWSVLLQALVTIAALVLSLLLALALAQPLSGPALEAIARRVEKQLGAPPRPETPFLIDVARSLGSALLGLGFGLPFLVLALALHFVPGGTLVAVPLKFLIAMVAIAWDLCDYPLSVRGVALVNRIRFVTRHFSAVLGFSLGAALVALLPCGALLLLPAGVAGATRLVLELEQSDRRENR